MKKAVFKPKITERKLICSCDLDGDSCTLLVQVRPEPSVLSAKHSRDWSINGKKVSLYRSKKHSQCRSRRVRRTSAATYLPLALFIPTGSFNPSRDATNNTLHLSVCLGCFDFSLLRHFSNICKSVLLYNMLTLCSFQQQTAGCW